MNYNNKDTGVQKLQKKLHKSEVLCVSNQWKFEKILLFSKNMFRKFTKIFRIV